MIFRCFQNGAQPNSIIIDQHPITSAAMRCSFVPVFVDTPALYYFELPIATSPLFSPLRG
jgi:hypothetical protein